FEPLTVTVVPHSVAVPLSVCRAKVSFCVSVPLCAFQLVTTSLPWPVPWQWNVADHVPLRLKAGPAAAATPAASARDAAITQTPSEKRLRMFPIRPPRRFPYLWQTYHRVQTAEPLQRAGPALHSA